MELGLCGGVFRSCGVLQLLFQDGDFLVRILRDRLDDGADGDQAFSFAACLCFRDGADPDFSRAAIDRVFDDPYEGVRFLSDFLPLEDGQTVPAQRILVGLEGPGIGVPSSNVQRGCHDREADWRITIMQPVLFPVGYSILQALVIFLNAEP